MLQLQLTHFTCIHSTICTFLATQDGQFITVTTQLSLVTTVLSLVTTVLSLVTTILLLVTTLLLHRNCITTLFFGVTYFTNICL